MKSVVATHFCIKHDPILPFMRPALSSWLPQRVPPLPPAKMLVLNILYYTGPQLKFDAPFFCAILLGPALTANYLRFSFD